MKEMLQVKLVVAFVDVVFVVSFASGHLLFSLHLFLIVS